MSSKQQYQSCFEQVFDVCVAGTGYAGFAAALALHEAGRKVLLLGERGDLLWEGGRAFAHEAGECDSVLWSKWIDELAERHGARNGEIDGAIAEVLATKQLVDRDLDVLYYAYPIAMERNGDACSGMIVATKNGVRRIAAKQWIDATETGQLVRLIAPDAKPRSPEAKVMCVFLHRENWPAMPASIAAPTMWDTERRIEIVLAGDHASPTAEILPTLKSLHEAHGDLFAEAVMSHCSVVPYPVYGAGSACDRVASNVACAAPSMAAGATATLGDRFALGLAAVAQINGMPSADVSQSTLTTPILAVKPVAELTADVVVAGAGTGGVVAAIASAREGAKTICVEPMAFAGGIGSGGGIHMYYFGVTGGLQSELDVRLKEVMPLLGGIKRVAGFHPDGRKLVLEQMMREAGVQFVTESLLYDVTTEGGRIASAMIAGADGPIRLVAPAWVDGTGDGDLCARAGAEFTMGREGDGLMHAYSQSSGRIAMKGWAAGADTSKLGMRIVNYDAGWVDPTDTDDLSRARIVGICQYARESYDPETRPTYIAPALGLRQGRQVITDYVLSLEDLIERRKFEDVIGFTGCHYDNHATDYEFESDRGMFWIWGLRQWRTRIACELPYRMLVPRGLDNVWLACRAVGVSQDAHHCMRMQRDMQRIGEAAGDAAAIAAKTNTTARSLPFEQLRQSLCRTEALDLSVAERPIPFDQAKAEVGYFELPDDAALIEAGLAAMDSGEPTGDLWHVYRAGDRVAAQVRERLASERTTVSWLAALVCAMWGDSAAEPRLIHAIETREYGFDDVPEDRRPERSRRDVPNWMTAIALLRLCGTEACMPVLAAVAKQANLPLNARTTIGFTLERLSRRGVIEDRQAVQAVLDQLTAGEVPDRFVEPQRGVGRINTTGIGEGRDVMAPPADQRVEAYTSTHEDHLWQLHLVVAKARRAIGLDVHEAATRYVRDPRASVRKAFAKVMN